MVRLNLLLFLCNKKIFNYFILFWLNKKKSGPQRDECHQIWYNEVFEWPKPHFLLPFFWAHNRIPPPRSRPTAAAEAATAAEETGRWAMPSEDPWPGRPLFPTFLSLAPGGAEESEAFPPPQPLLFLSFLFLQQGSMDLSKVGEKILGSVRSARSLALLPSSDHRPEVTRFFGTIRWVFWWNGM